MSHFTGFWGLLLAAQVYSVDFPNVRLTALLADEEEQHMSPSVWKGVQPFVGLKCGVDEPGVSGCGESLICSAGVCSHCTSSKECPDKFACIQKPDMLQPDTRLCMPRDIVAHWTNMDLVCTILIALTAALSAAAGLGGGGVYVPLTILLVGLKTSEAVPLSQTMVLAGSIVNVVLLLGDRHPKYPDRPKIAYDVVMLLNPGLAFGVTTGVLAHLVSPAWLTLSCLLVTLIFAFQKSWTRGCRLYKQELADHAAASNGGSGGAGAGPQGPGRSSSKEGVSVKSLLQAEEARQLEAQGIHETLKVAKQASMIFLCWMASLMINLMHPERCSQGHWMQLGMLFVIAAVFTICGAKVTHLHNDDLDMKGHEIKFGALAFLAGFLGGFLGIGGGLVMGPVLLELGLLPEVGQATTALFVLLSSSLGTAQFVLLGKEMPYFVLWYAFWVAVSTIAGQLLSDWIVRAYNHTSFIVFAVSGVVFFSAVMMMWVGTADVMDNWSSGAHMGVDLMAVCGGH
jgi:uncharacterized membrane protein YfcA